MIADDLKRARAVIANSRNWTRGSYARDAFGGPVSPTEPDAARFDVTGAIHKVTGRAYSQAETFFERFVRKSLTAFNDDNAHETVVAKLDEAIAAAMKGERV